MGLYLKNIATSAKHPEESMARNYVLKRAIELHRSTAPRELLSQPSTSSIFGRTHPLAPPPWLPLPANAPAPLGRAQPITLSTTDCETLNTYLPTVIDSVQVYYKRYLSTVRARDRTRTPFVNWMREQPWPATDNEAKAVAHGVVAAASTHSRVSYRSITWRVESVESNLTTSSSGVSQLLSSENRWRYGSLQQVIAVQPHLNAQPVLLARVNWLSIITLPEPPQSPLTVVRHRARDPDHLTPFVLVSSLHPAHVCFWPKNNAVSPDLFVIPLDTNSDLL
jgi:hypothetical protein